MDTCLKLHKQNPLHCFSSPELSWDVMLKVPGVGLEKFFDNAMFLFIEKGLRGGVLRIYRRFSKANNKYMKNYDPRKPRKYIMSFDANNLYRWAMRRYLPYGRFKWFEKC